MAFSFTKSEGHSIGIEVEVQLLDKHTFALTDSSTKIVDALEEGGKSIKHELMMSNLEVNTKVCSDISEAQEDLCRKMLLVRQEADRHETTLSLAGSHPFSLWNDQQITENDRYNRLVDKLAIIAKRFNIFGLHVHVGVDGGEKCIYIMNRMLYFLPHLLALSSNSPFWNGHITGLKSYRSKVFEALPTAGLPFYFKDWNDYARLVECYIKTGTIETIREIWWDIRPHPDFGTIEIRVCDSPTTLSEIMAIASIIQALVTRLGNEYDRGVPFKKPFPWVIRENKWRAARYGLEGEFISEDGYSNVKIVDAIRNLIDYVEGESEKLGSTSHLHSIEEILQKGDGASRQLRVWQESSDLNAVVKYLNRELLDDLESMPVTEIDS